MSDLEFENVYQHGKKQLKIVMLGNQSVGKSSLIRRYCYNDFSRIYVPTVGADFFIKNNEITEASHITVHLTDVNGIDMSKQMFETYLYKVNIIILVYDISDTKSFDYISSWLKKTRDVMGQKEEVAEIAIFGNKNDLEHKRTVRIDKTKQFIEDHQFAHYSVSAKTGENVNSSFTELIAKYFHIPLTWMEKEKLIVQAELMPDTPTIAMPHRKRINKKNAAFKMKKISAKQISTIDNKTDKDTTKISEKSCTIQ